MNQDLHFNIQTPSWPTEPIIFYFSKENIGYNQKIYKTKYPEIIEQIFRGITINNSKKLIGQVYQFSLLYWKSLKQQNVPITIKYPEMVAQIAPHFDGDISLDAKDKLWFL